MECEFDRVKRFWGITRRGAGKGITKMRDENCCFRLLRERRRCFFAVPALLSRCYLPRLSGESTIQIRALAETAGENARYQRHVGCSSPLAPAKNPRISAASPPRLLQIPLHLQQNGHRPPGPTRRHYRAQRSSVWLQIRCKCSQTPLASPHEAGNRCQPPACDLAPAWSVARWKHANQRDALDQGRPG
jgi:hypothetical protein